MHNPREFKVSSLERLAEMPAVREFLGIEFDADGRVRGTVDRGQFEAAYGRILTDIVGGLDTREVNTVERAQKYLRSIADLAPKKKGSFGSEDFDAATSTKRSPSRAASATAKARAAPREMTSLISKRRKCPVRTERIRRIWEELQDLKVDDVPNATAVLVRILLELAVGRYLKKTGNMTEILDHYRKKDGKKTEWSPSLRQMLDPLLKDANFQNRTDPQVLKRIRQLVAQEKSSWSIESLDGFIHSEFAVPNSRDVRGVWALIEEILDVILVEDVSSALAAVPRD